MSMKFGDAEREVRDPNPGCGDPALGDWRLSGGDAEYSKGFGTGDMKPGVPAGLFRGGRVNASAAARSRRLVVPSALVDPERAEQTTATLY